MRRNKDFGIRLALPSKGELEASTLGFLAASGLDVDRSNPRQYTASVPSFPEMAVSFQRAADIPSKVGEGSADLGITGYDIVHECGGESGALIILHDHLGFGRCTVVFAVPESWIDVSSIGDLADLALLFKEKGKQLRIATKYPNSTREFLHARVITNFSLVQVQGALEGAPRMGYADLIVDVTSTGTTLRENRLKKIAGGTLFESQACLIGSRECLREEGKLAACKALLEKIEAYLRSKEYVSITARVHGETPESIVYRLMKKQDLIGLQGPSIAKVHSKGQGDKDLYAATIIVERDLLLEAVDHLRRSGGTDILVFSPSLVFDSKCWSYEGLVRKLKVKHKNGALVVPRTS